MILRARTVLPMDGPPIENGAVVIDDNVIVAVGAWEDLKGLNAGPETDLGEVILLPGLINAHCHLDYTMMRHAISPPRSFTAWVQRINALKRSLDSQDYLRAIERGFSELQRNGTTTVCNIEAFPELMPRMPVPPIRTWWFYEMIDVRHRITTDDVIAGALAFFRQRTPSTSSFGLSPHAPYTASRSLFRLANECANTMSLLLTTHVAESREESAMFVDRCGPLFDFMTSIGRPMEDCGHGSPFSMLWRCGAINGHWLLAHMNELTEDDFTLIATLPSDEKPNVVHCPGSHRYFGHSPFHFRRLAAAGVNICVGTDSLASTDSLSLLGELRSLSKTESWMTPEELLRTVTVNAARALRRPGRLGRLGPGALADLIAIPHIGAASGAYETVIAHHGPVLWMMNDGHVASLS